MTLSSRPAAQEWLATWAAALVVASAYATGRVPFSNIDDHSIRVFASDYLGASLAALTGEPGSGRFRPIYWLIEGGLGALTGSTATLLHYGRLVFLMVTVALIVRIARRLGAPLGFAVLVAVGAGWSVPALGVWTLEGPAEAFSIPLALGAVLLVLRAESSAGIAAAASLGLAACLVKETTSAWTAAALLAWALRAFLAREERAARWVAVAGAAAQFLPVAIALFGNRVWAGSYPQHVVATIAVEPTGAAFAAFNAAPLTLAAGLAALVFEAFRMLRGSPRDWSREDLVAVGPAIAIALQSVALGLALERYLLPAVVAFGLLASRAAGDWWRLPRQRLAAGLLTLAALPVLTACGYRATLATSFHVADARTDEKFRLLLGDALVRKGSVRILWVPSDVERPIGALAHLAADGIQGEVEMAPCTPYPAGNEKLLASYFAKYARPLTGAGPFVLSTLCPGAGVWASDETACVLVLPSISGRPPGRDCFRLREKAMRVGAP